MLGFCSDGHIHLAAATTQSKPLVYVLLVSYVVIFQNPECYEISPTV